MRARGSAWLLWQYFDTHKATICMAAQKGRLSSIFNKQEISACKEGEGWRGEGRGGDEESVGSMVCYVNTYLCLHACLAQCMLT